MPRSPRAGRLGAPLEECGEARVRLTFRLAEAPISLEQAARDDDVAFGSLPSVTPSSTTLPGGPLEVVDRHSCVWEGARFAHLVLRYKDTLVSVVVAGDGGATASWIPWPQLDHEQTLPSVAGLQMTSFRGARHVAFVVSTLPDADVQAVARVMEGPVSRALAGTSPPAYSRLRKTPSRNARSMASCGRYVFFVRIKAAGLATGTITPARSMTSTSSATSA